MDTLFETAASDPSLIAEIVDLMQAAASDAGVSSPDDPFGYVRMASENPAFKAAMLSRLSELASARGLSLVAEASASLDGAKALLDALKDKPVQVPIGTPIALVFISAALIFLPSVLGVTGSTMFGAQDFTDALQGVDL